MNESVTCGGFSFVMEEPQWRAERKLAGGGPLMDLGIYPVQAACMAAGGAAPVAITASERPKQRTELKSEIAGVGTKIVELRTELKTEIDNVRAELKADNVTHLAAFRS
jgi:predicted dehydrogenase